MSRSGSYANPPKHCYALAQHILTVLETFKDKKFPSTNMYLFGYGSLINPRSVESTIQRQINKTDLECADLVGFCRVWNFVTNVMLEGRIDPLSAVFLNIQPDQDTRANGVLIPMEEKEFLRMDKREKGYERILITDKISPSPEKEVYTLLLKKMLLSLPQKVLS